MAKDEDVSKNLALSPADEASGGGAGALNFIAAMVGGTLLVLAFLEVVSWDVFIWGGGAALVIGWISGSVADDERERATEVATASRVTSGLAELRGFYDGEQWVGVDWRGVATNEALDELCVMDISDKPGDFRRYSFKDLVSAEVVKDGAVVTKADRGSQAAGALVGAAVMGGAGAVIGGLSAKTTSSKDVSRVSVRLTLDDAKHPLHSLTFYKKDPAARPEEAERALEEALEKAERCYALLTVGMRRAQPAQG